MTSLRTSSVSLASMLLLASATLACGDDAQPTSTDHSSSTGDGDDDSGDGDGDSGDGDSGDGDTSGDGDATGDGDVGDGDVGDGDGDATGDGDGDFVGDGDGDLTGGDGDANGDGDGDASSSGVCGGDTPHGCYKPKAGNPAGCGPQIFEQSGWYPPLEEWQGCGMVAPYETCAYVSPKGVEASCVCDFGLHWLCTYPATP